MSRDIKTSLKKDFFIQEIVFNLLAVPPLAYFIVMGFPALREHIVLFVSLVVAAVAASLLYQVLVSWWCKRKIVRVLDRDMHTVPDRELTAAKRQAFSFPVTAASAHLIRWVVIGFGVVFLPFYIKGIITGKDIIFIILFLFFSSIMSMTFSFLRSEYTISEFLRLSAIHAAVLEKNSYLKVSMTKKFIIINVFLVLAPVGNILTAVYLSISSGILLESIQIGFWLLVGQGLVLSVINGRQLSANTKSSVLAVASFLEEMSSLKGDLRRRIPPVTSDEIGDLATEFNQFLDSLQNLIIDIKKSAGELKKIVNGINTGSQELASRTHEQAASITETSTTIEGFTRIVKHNGQSSQEANRSLEEFKTEIQTNTRLIEDVTNTMKRIDESSKKINNIVDVINDISFQTNLLALNAAIEAARAGEAGRGFSVVANEVRNLAQKTAESSASIQEIVSQNLQAATEGVEQIHATAKFFETIVGKIEEMTEKIVSIAHGSREQTTGIDQINNAISQLDQTVSQNSRLVDNFSAAIDTLQEKEDGLNQSIKNFKTSSN